MLIRHFLIFSVLISVAFLLQSCASGSSASSKVSWSDTEMTFDISSHGKSKKDVVDAIEVWGAKNFSSWQKYNSNKITRQRDYSIPLSRATM